MRILIYGINFTPELVGIGKFSGEMARHLAQAGHEVRVLTASPYYPDWRVRPGYSAWAYRRETLDGCQVFRCPLWVPARPSGFSRILHLLSFAAFSAPVLLAQVKWQPAVILTVAPAIASAPLGWLTARLAGAAAWLHIQDFELDAALSLQMAPGLHTFGNLLLGLEKGLLQRFDRVSTISQRMLERLWHKGVPEPKSRLLPNWVDCQAIFPQTASNPFREQWGVPPDQIVVLYSGSMGQKQGLELLIQAARQLQLEPHIHFILCGEGSARPGLQELAVGLNNLTFMPLQPAEKLNQLLNAADIHILIQRANAADLVMPSKLTGMLASGKPVIATALPETELGRVVLQVGLLVQPGDQPALCEAILRLANHPGLRRQLGAQGRQFALEYLDQQTILDRLIGELVQVAGERRR